MYIYYREYICVDLFMYLYTHTSLIFIYMYELLMKRTVHLVSFD